MQADLTDPILETLRRIMRALDRHSRALMRTHGLTGPQALILREVVRAGELSVGELARAVNLSQATVTDILLRLEARQMLVRRRADQDRRRVLVSATETGRRLAGEALPLLQERFGAELRRLPDWEQTQLLAALQRVAAMLRADILDAEPLLSGAPPADAGLHPRGFDGPAAQRPPVAGTPLRARSRTDHRLPLNERD